MAKQMLTKLTIYSKKLVKEGPKKPKTVAEKVTISKPKKKVKRTK